VGWKTEPRVTSLGSCPEMSFPLVPQPVTGESRRHGPGSSNFTGNMTDTTLLIFNNLDTFWPGGIQGQCEIFRGFGQGPKRCGFAASCLGFAAKKAERVSLCYACLLCREPELGRKQEGNDHGSKSQHHAFHECFQKSYQIFGHVIQLRDGKTIRHFLILLPGVENSGCGGSPHTNPWFRVKTRTRFQN